MQVAEEFHHLEKLDIEKASGPTSSVSPVVVVPKPVGSPYLHRQPYINTAIESEKHLIPTIDELIADMTGATIFSKIDLNKGYHQLQLHPDSRSITTFSTHLGLFRYKRLSFGISCTAKIFQHKIAEVIQNIAGATNISEDIMIYTKEGGHFDTLHSLRQTSRTQPDNQ